MPFQWHYKACPCCGSVIPDSRRDQLGSCQLCGTARELLASPPDGWFEQVEIKEKGKLPRLTTRWMHEWRNRGDHDMCRHERKALYRQRAAAMTS